MWGYEAAPTMMLPYSAVFSGERNGHRMAKTIHELWGHPVQHLTDSTAEETQHHIGLNKPLTQDATVRFCEWLHQV